MPSARSASPTCPPAPAPSPAATPVPAHDDLHLTVKGRRVELEQKSGCEKATEQFQISDTRSAAEIAAMLRAKSLDPVWKDWDEALLAVGG